MSIKKSITWDEDVTNVLSARLDIIVDPSRLDTRAWVEHNMTEIQRWWWEWDHDLRSESIDIIGTLHNGSNLFKLAGAKDILTVPFLVVFTVTASVVIEYEGEEPEIGEDWARILQEVASGVAVGGGAYLIGSSVLAAKKERR